MSKKMTFVLFIMVTSISLKAQINFEPGYIVNNAGQKINCLIKNEAWGNTPYQFTYKLEGSSTPQTGTVANTKEFGIPGLFKYSRYMVKIDRSSDNLQKMSQQKEPEFTEENVFLENLLEGDATLFLYEDGNLKRYFYTLKNQIKTPEPLIFKRYKTYETGNTNIQGFVLKNEEYKRQLWNNLKCNNTSIAKIKDIDYINRDLMKVFTIYNECHNATSTNYQDKKGKGTFNLRVSAGFNTSSLSVKTDDPLATFDKNVDFDNAITIRGGIELEYVFAFNKNKWAVFAEPNYNYYKEDGETTNQTASVEYTSLEIPIGLRHYFFLNKNLKLFANSSFNFDFILGDSKLTYSATPEAEIESGTSLGLGLGLAAGKNFTAEVRYNTTNGLFESAGRKGNFNKTSFIVRYKIL